MGAVRAPQREHVYSVTELTRNVKGMLESAFQAVWVEGELSGGKVVSSGHFYGTLKDENSQIDVVMWKGALRKLGFDFENGTQYLCLGNVGVYERRGTYQLILQKVEPAGIGALQVQFEQLKKRLAVEGLFDEKRKKPLPAFPKRVGVVTSASSAALRDILSVLQRRFAGLEILVHDARVQGDGAPDEIVRAIETLDRLGACDVLIVGRGGGSLEDLWAFNTEPVARAIFAARTPIISAVGHEVDYTIADFVADQRAPTPSAAAELVVHERDIVVDRVREYRRRLESAVTGTTNRQRERLARVLARYGMRRAEDLHSQRAQQLDHVRARLQAASPLNRLRAQVERLRSARAGLRAHSPQRRLPHIARALETLRRRTIRAGVASVARADERFRRSVGQLDALSPLRVLARGYSVTRLATSGVALTEARSAAPGDRVHIRLHRGSLDARVEHVWENGHG